MAGRVDHPFWRGRSVSVTGHTGFKGGWLTLLLDRLGANVHGLALPAPAGPSLFDQADVGAVCTSRMGDIRDTGETTSALSSAAPEIVFHLAAQALVRPAYASPAETFATNVMGTVNVLEAVRQTPSVKAVVVVTSDKVYDNVEWPWAYREDDRLGGKEPYGASKACTEIVVQSYRHAYLSSPKHRVAIATARAGNVIGGGDWAVDRLVPDAVRAFSKDEPLIVRNPAAVRPWQHVLEPLVGYMKLAEKLTLGADMHSRVTFNFGPSSSDATSVSRVADEVAKLWGEGASWQQDKSTHPYEARLLEVDSALARSVLGWSPRWTVDTALARTIDWYKAFHTGRDMRALTREQIDQYLHD